MAILFEPIKPESKFNVSGNFPGKSDNLRQSSIVSEMSLNPGSIGNTPLWIKTEFVRIFVCWRYFFSLVMGNG